MAYRKDLERSSAMMLKIKNPAKSKTSYSESSSTVDEYTKKDGSTSDVYRRGNKKKTKEKNQLLQTFVPPKKNIYYYFLFPRLWNLRFYHFFQNMSLTSFLSLLAITASIILHLFLSITNNCNLFFKLKLLIDRRMIIQKN